MNKYELHFVLHFREEKTGATYADATCKTEKEVKKAVSDSKKRGWILEKKAIECIERVGFFEIEQLAYQEI